MGLFGKAKPDNRVYSSGEDSRTQNSRVYLVALIAYMGIFLFGYDSGVAGGVISLTSFQRDFNYINDTAVQKASKGSNVVALLQVGAFFGALGAAPVCQKIGRKKSLFIGTIVFMIGGVVSTVAMKHIEIMIVGRVICGLGIGLLSTVCPTYVAEMTPKNVRGRITGLFQIIVVIGVAFSYWIEYAISVTMGSTKSATWRIPIAFQLVPCGLMLILLPLIKESPRWLILKGRNDEALANLAWVRKRGIEDPRVVAEFDENVAAITEELAVTSGASYNELLKKGMKIRVFIAFACFFLQQWSGQNSISYYAPTIFQSIGLRGTSVSLLASGIYGIVKIFSTSLFIFVGIERVGRKWSLAFGALGMSLFLWIVGAIFVTHVPNAKATSPSGASIGMAAMIYMFVIPYCFSWGPVPWVYCSEIFPTRVRAQGMSIAAATQWCFNFVLTKITPYLVLDLPNGKIFFLFACTNLLSAAFGFWIPETKGLSLEQMDVLFGSITQEERDKHIAEAERARELQQAGGYLSKEKELEIDHVEHVEGVDASSRV
ncbi:sugar transporter [Phaffia rhodozyma]|uniref:Sugar transporter n=1 Tax=Phaffia rhodozyma TaxID=264483 RepID=A0A0F7SR83_PHARH|nr:sugar transporter [Phaffia rhodozyma]